MIMDRSGYDMMGDISRFVMINIEMDKTMIIPYTTSTNNNTPTANSESW